MKYFRLLILLLLLTPALIFLLRPGQYWNMHDDMQPVRQLQLEKCLLDGQIPCRWAPDLGYGYGYPLFNFYPPMPYIVGQFYRLLGFSIISTVKLTAATQFVASALAMYLLTAPLFGSFGALISALFYTYAPYHALNIYVRGAMNEAWAAVFFPLVFHFTRQLVRQPTIKNSIFLGLSFAGILLSHNPMALIITPFLALWFLYLLYRNFSYRHLLYLALSALIALSLSAFYTLPVLFETKLVQIESMFQNYYHFSVHFTTLFQLFISNFWGDGASVWGTEDNMSFMVGYLHWLLPLSIIVFLLIKSLKRRQIHPLFPLVSILALFSLISLFMTHNKSTPIWLLFAFVQKIQFPWRFLNLAVFFLSFMAGVSAKIFPKSVNFILIISLIFLNKSYFTPITHGPINDQQKFSGQAWVYQITSGIYDYLPKTARIAAQSPAQKFIDQVDPPMDYQLTGTKQGTDWTLFNLNLPQPAKVTLARLDFPRFVVTDNGQVISHQTEPELGRIVINLPAGHHQIYLKLHNTPIRNLANILSLLGLTFLLFSWKLKK